jgi:putative transposase
VQQDGIRFMGMRYIDPTLAAYVGEDVILRYDPRDMAEVRLFYNERFLCRAVCHELSGEVVSLREIKHARDRHRRSLRQTIKDRRRAVEAILEARRCDPVDKPARQEEPKPAKKRNNLKRYFND